MKALVRFLLIFATAKLIVAKPQHLQEQAQLDPLNEPQFEYPPKDPSKRTIGSGRHYALGKHVGIHPLGFKYVLGYRPINIKYVPVIKPVTVLKPVLHQNIKPLWKPVMPPTRHYLPTFAKPLHTVDHGWKPILRPIEPPPVVEQPFVPVPALPPPAPALPPPASVLPAHPLHNYYFFQTPVLKPSLQVPLFHVTKPQLGVLPLGASFPSPVLSPTAHGIAPLPGGSPLYHSIFMQAIPVHPEHLPAHPLLPPAVSAHPINVPRPPVFHINRPIQPSPPVLHFDAPIQPSPVHPSPIHPFSIQPVHPSFQHSIYPSPAHPPVVNLDPPAQPSPIHPFSIHPIHPSFHHSIHPSPAHPPVVKLDPASPIHPSSIHPIHPYFHQPVNHSPAHPSVVNLDPPAQPAVVHLDPPAHPPDQSHAAVLPPISVEFHGSRNFGRQPHVLAFPQELNHQPQQPFNPHAAIQPEHPPDQSHPAVLPPISVEFHGNRNLGRQPHALAFPQELNHRPQAPFNPHAAIQPGQTDLQFPVHLPQHPHLGAFQPFGSIIRPSVSLEPPMTHGHT